MIDNEVRIIFAGGGTGGHVFPAIYLANFFKKHWKANCIFIGTKKGIESRKVPQSGFIVKHIWISGFHRRFDLRNLLFPLKLIVSLWQSKREIKAFNPNLVIGTGGYVSGPVLYQAAKMKIATIIQEQNSYPGITTRILSSKVDHVFAAYEDAIKYLKDKTNCSVIGNPVRQNLGQVDKKIAMNFFGLNKKTVIILVFGGSQGAKNLNKAIDNLITTGTFSGAQLVWQTGEKEFNIYKKKYEIRDFKNIHILPFIDKMDYAYSVCDFVISRAGAMTIAELIAMNLPAVLVPFPGAAANHQYKNAKTLADAGAAMIVKDNDSLTSGIENAIEKLKSNIQMRNDIKENLKQFYNPDAINKIAETIDEVLKLKKEKN
jgi:UDP-N-acetylglucosamine--N-acetylmuramyl-(pentapeptide) pyrophosphoryl-undecaprenol N-acetylglucosamine transferase